MNSRKFSRVNFQVAAAVTAAAQQIDGEVENLSMSGMFMVTGGQLQLGEPVDISIVLSGTTPGINVNIAGRVSRIVENGIGFSFEKIDIDSYTHLKKIITYNTDNANRVLEEIHHAIDEKIASEP